MSSSQLASDASAPGHQIEIVVVRVDNREFECAAMHKGDGSVALIPLDPADIDLLSESSDKIRLDTSEGPMVFSPIEIVTVQAVDGQLRPFKLVDNRRQSYRAKADFRVDITLDGEYRYELAGEDISEGGLLAVSQSPIDVEVDQRVLARVCLPGHSPKPIAMLVKRVRTPIRGPRKGTTMIGMQYITLNSVDRHDIVQYIYKTQVAKASYR